MTNLKGPTTSEGAWAFFFQIMPPCRQYIFKLVQNSFAIVEIKKCTNLQQIRSERVKESIYYRTL